MCSSFCNLCGQPLDEDYTIVRRTTAHGGLVVCAECAATAPVCALCGVPLQRQPIRLSDGRPVCAVCFQTAVDDPITARTIYEQVIHVVSQQLCLCVHRRPGFSLCSMADMTALQQHLPRELAGASGHLLGAYLKMGRRREIVIESGLPRMMMVKVIAHEYAHAWQGENCPFVRDPQLIEGFCEWVAYKVLGAFGAVDVQTHQRHRRGFYGDSLRRLLAIESEGGAAAVLSALRTPHISVMS